MNAVLPRLCWSFFSVANLLLATLFAFALPAHAQTYDDWAQQMFNASELADPNLSGQTADPSGRGVPNLLAYSLRLDPHAPESTMLPAVGVANGHLTLTFTILKDSLDLIYTPAASPDLQTWSSGVTAASVLGFTDNGDDTASVTVFDLASATGSGRRFVRLQLSLGAAGSILPAWWQLQYFNSLNVDPNALALRGDGLTNLQAWQQGLNPNDFFNGQPPVLSITGGNNQTGPPATFLDQPLIVKVTNAAGTPLVNAPVTFTINDSSGGLAVATGGSVTTSLFVRTDAAGTAQVCYAGLLAGGAAGSIHVTAGASSTTFNESTSPYDSTVASPTEVTATPGTGNGETNVTWVNNASNATFFLILRSIDSVYWTKIATINDPAATSYIAAGLNPAQSYYFGVIAGNPN
jgi:hypothetical protein